MTTKHFHFIFGLKEQTEAFHIAWYLCLRSCIDVNQPDRISLYYLNEPYGPWWEKIKPELELVKIDELNTGLDESRYRQHYEGRFIQAAGLEYAHHADIIRLQVLLENGGVYADIDTLFVKPYPDSFYLSQCVLGRETITLEVETLCNAVIFAQANSEFVQRWLDGILDEFDGSWNQHSCAFAARLSSKYSELVEVAPKQNFYHFAYTEQGIADLLGRSVQIPSDLYSIHLWSHLWWSEERNDFAKFHAGMLTENFIRNVDTSYNLIARRFLD